MQLTIQVNYIAYILTMSASIIIAFAGLCALEWLLSKIKRRNHDNRNQ